MRPTNLCLTELESRAAPARFAVAVSGGAVYERVGDAWAYRVSPFEAGVPAHVAADTSGVYVGAGERGAPRVVRYDKGWHLTESVFVGDPDSREGVDLYAFDRPSAGLASTDPLVQSHLDRVPPLPVDLSGVVVHTYPAGTVFDAPGLPAGALGYFQPADRTIHIRVDFAPLVVHEVGHAVGWAWRRDMSEAFAWRFHDWVNGASDAELDAWAFTGL